MAFRLLVARFLHYSNKAPLIRASDVFFSTGFLCSARRDPSRGGLRVIHERDQFQFTVSLGSAPSEQAVLLYEYMEKGTVNLLHTRVPAVYRGQGIAQLLAKAAMDFVIEENLKAHVTCWYIKKYLQENPRPEYQKHIIN